jgi:hypothetical protein
VDIDQEKLEVVQEELDVAYLFVGGVYEAVCSYTRNQVILCAWAICANGTKEMIGIPPFRWTGS